MGRIAWLPHDGGERFDHFASAELAMRPRCPDCDGRIIASGRRFTCLIVGHRHYDQPIASFLH